MRRTIKITGPADQLDAVAQEAEGYDLRIKRHRGKPPYLAATGFESQLKLLMQNARRIGPEVKSDWP
jgi:hypothetical protein